jgi:hypothetical protein
MLSKLLLTLYLYRYVQKPAYKALEVAVSGSPSMHLKKTLISSTGKQALSENTARQASTLPVSTFTKLTPATRSSLRLQYCNTAALWLKHTPCVYVRPCMQISLKILLPDVK